jgi:uncharacterized SAM-binding protein YcdF (DUF218 family)
MLRSDSNALAAARSDERDEQNRTPRELTVTPARTRARALWGLLLRRERWSFSWRGWIILALLVVGTGTALVLRVQPFFALTARVDAPVVAVEGWVHEYAIRSAAGEFVGGRCRQFYTTGGPVSGLGRYVNDYQTVASVAAGRLRAVGVPAERIQMVPCRAVTRDRTYSAAVALRDWLAENRQSITAINVLTEDVHARRTRLLFQKAFGDRVKVGVISVPNPDYDAGHWWRYSEGVREIIGECIAYSYAKFFFHPPPEERLSTPPAGGEGSTE